MDSQRPNDVSPEAMQARIQQARREAEGLKDRIKRKKDELADTTRKPFLLDSLDRGSRRHLAPSSSAIPVSVTKQTLITKIIALLMPQIMHSSSHNPLINLTAMTLTFISTQSAMLRSDHTNRFRRTN